MAAAPLSSPEQSRGVRHHQVSAFLQRFLALGSGWDGSLEVSSLCQNSLSEAHQAAPRHPETASLAG